MIRLVVLFSVVAFGYSQESPGSPSRLPAATGKTNNETCSSDAIGIQLAQSRDFLQSLFPQCACGESGEWTRVAYVNMEDPSHQCPSGWNLFTGPVRGCVSSIPNRYSCGSAIFPTNGHNSHVCGRVTAYQRGFPEAFSYGLSSYHTLEDLYVDGVSITHGAAGSRQHIWSFAAATSENENYGSDYHCDCINTRQNHRGYPDFVGNNYFCDTGNIRSLQQIMTFQFYSQITPCGTVKVVVLTTPAVKGTIPHGSAPQSRPQQTISR